MNSQNSQRRARPLLGTLVEISGEGMSDENLRDAVSEAFGEVEKVHRLMSFHDPQSDVSMLNRFAFQKTVRVHPWTFEVLKAACRIALKTDGLFDCAVASPLMRWGYLPPMHGQLSKNSTGNWKHIAFPAANHLRFKKPLVIDLGGIAKGFAVDKAVVFLKRRGVPSGCVNAGGDLRVFGPVRRILYVRHPAYPGALCEINPGTETALATSAIYFSRKKYLNRWVSPIVYPGNKSSCMTSRSVSVLAPTCMMADALTKPVLLSRHPEEILKKFHVRAFVLDAEKSFLKDIRHAA